MTTVLWVALGAAIGAPARYLTDRAVQGWHDSVFPWGTLTVNMVGSFLLGLLTAMSTNLSPAVSATVGVGFCGALTTYSTFSYEIVAFLDVRDRLMAAAYLLVSVVTGVGSAAAGWALAGLAV
jgi:CrcB protein